MRVSMTSRAWRLRFSSLPACAIRRRPVIETHITQSEASSSGVSVTLGPITRPQTVYFLETAMCSIFFGAPVLLCFEGITRNGLAQDRTSLASVGHVGTCQCRSTR